MARHDPFAQMGPPAQGKPWTIYATSRKKPDIRTVNRRRDRLISHKRTTEIGFETRAEAEDYAARLPRDKPWSFTVVPAGQTQEESCSPSSPNP